MQVPARLSHGIDASHTFPAAISISHTRRLTLAHQLNSCACTGLNPGGARKANCSYSRGAPGMSFGRRGRTRASVHASSILWPPPPRETAQWHAPHLRGAWRVPKSSCQWDHMPVMKAVLHCSSMAPAGGSASSKDRSIHRYRRFQSMTRVQPRALAPTLTCCKASSVGPSR